MRRTYYLRCLHVPADRKNPYQRALGMALHSLGVRVQRRPFRWNLLAVMRRVDVLHIHWTSAVVDNPWWKFAMGMPWLALQLLILRVRRVRVVWTVHNLAAHESRRPVRNWLGSVLIGRLAQVVIVHGPSARESVARRFLIPRGKIAVIPHGNYLGLYPKVASRSAARVALGLGAESKVVLFLGHIRPYKGVEDLIEVFKNLGDPRAVLVIAGKPLNPAYQAQISRLSANHPQIRFFPGFVADARVGQFMSAADVVVFPYREVLTSGAVVLAMSFGKACVAARLGCIGDVLDENGGILYDPARRGALGRALAEALASPKRLEAMGQHNRAKAQWWSWPRVAAATAVAYAGVVPTFGLHRGVPVEAAAAAAD